MLTRLWACTIKKSEFDKKSKSTKGASCYVNTTLNPRIRRTPAHVIFLAWLKTWVIESGFIVCLTKQSLFTSSTACRTRFRCCFLHTWALHHFPHALQSDLLSDHLPDLRCSPFHIEISPAPIHRMCLPVPWLKRTRLQVMSLRISLKKTTLHWSNRCSSTDRVWRRLMIQLRALRHPPSWSGFGRWSNSEYAGITAVLTGEGSKCRPTTSSSLFARKLSDKFISFPRKCGETCRGVLTQKRVESRHTFREGISSGHQTVQGKGETLFRFSDREEAARTTLDDQRDRLLAEAKSEILKQECKVDNRNTCIREFQSNRLELDSKKKVGMKNLEESRPEFTKNWLNEKSTSRFSHPKYPWSRRIDEISRNAVWRILQTGIEGKSRYNTGGHFTNSGVAGSSEPYERFYRIPRRRIDLQWKIIPSSQPTGNCFKSCWGAKPRPKFATWYMEFVRYIGNVFDSPRAVIDSSSIPF